MLNREGNILGINGKMYAQLEVICFHPLTLRLFDHQVNNFVNNKNAGGLSSLNAKEIGENR